MRKTNNPNGFFPVVIGSMHTQPTNLSPNDLDSLLQAVSQFSQPENLKKKIKEFQSILTNNLGFSQEHGVMQVEFNFSSETEDETEIDNLFKEPTTSVRFVNFKFQFKNDLALALKSSPRDDTLMFSLLPSDDFASLTPFEFLKKLDYVISELKSLHSDLDTKLHVDEKFDSYARFLEDRLKSFYPRLPHGLGKVERALHLHAFASECINTHFESVPPSSPFIEEIKRERENYPELIPLLNRIKNYSSLISLLRSRRDNFYSLLSTGGFELFSSEDHKEAFDFLRSVWAYHFLCASKPCAEQIKKFLDETGIPRNFLFNHQERISFERNRLLSRLESLNNGFVSDLCHYARKQSVSGNEQGLSNQILVLVDELVASQQDSPCHSRFFSQRVVTLEQGANPYQRNDIIARLNLLKDHYFSDYLANQSSSNLAKASSILMVSSIIVLTIVGSVMGFGVPAIALLTGFGIFALVASVAKYYGTNRGPVALIDKVVQSSALPSPKA